MTQRITCIIVLLIACLISTPCIESALVQSRKHPLDFMSYVECIDLRSFEGVLPQSFSEDCYHDVMRVSEFNWNTPSSVTMIKGNLETFFKNGIGLFAIIGVEIIGKLTEFKTDLVVHSRIFLGAGQKEINAIRPSFFSAISTKSLKELQYAGFLQFMRPDQLSALISVDDLDRFAYIPHRHYLGQMLYPFDSNEICYILIDHYKRKCAGEYDCMYSALGDVYICWALMDSAPALRPKKPDEYLKFPESKQERDKLFV